MMLYTQIVIILPDDSDRPGHFPLATDPAVENCHSMPHTVSFSGWHPMSIYISTYICTYIYVIMCMHTHIYINIIIIICTYTQNW